MNSVPKTRQRAVKLTPEALELLRIALDKQWRSSGLSNRLTRQVRAELMGVSVPTSDLILARKGVDRSSLVLAFKSLELPWSEAYCDSPEETDSTEQTASSASVQDTGGRKAGVRSTGIRTGLILFVFVALVFSIGLFTWNKRTQLYWINEHDQELKIAADTYHKGDYTESEVHLSKAMKIAETHDTARNFPAALKLKGDIACARGQLSFAEDTYLALVMYREIRKQQTWGPLHEALGSVQTRLKKFDLAEQSLNIAFDAFTKSGEQHGIAEVYRSRGCLASATNRLPEALEWFAKSSQILSTQDDPDMVIDVRGERAMVLIKFEKIQEAQKELEECLAYWNKDGQLRWMALSEMRVGLVEAKLGKTSDALQRFTKAKLMFDKVGDEAWLAEAESHLKSL